MGIVLGWSYPMIKNRMQEIQDQAADERQRCRQWLLRFMDGTHSEFLTKAELRGAAMQELNVSKNSFAWIDAIETTGRHDWHEPLRRRSSTKC